jgi:hypothetical protein
MSSRVLHKGELRRKIKWESLIYLVAGLAVIVVAFIVLSFIQLPQWLETPKETLRSDELASLGRLAEDKAVFTSEVRRAARAGVP